jgi:hypothetical protein
VSEWLTGGHEQHLQSLHVHQVVALLVRSGSGVSKVANHLHYCSRKRVSE